MWNERNRIGFVGWRGGTWVSEKLSIEVGINFNKYIEQLYLEYWKG
jgi:hypothetical protein